MTLWALCFVLAINQRFEPVRAFVADVLEDRHSVTPGQLFLLESICGQFAIKDRGADFPAAAGSGWRASPDPGGIFPVSKNYPAGA